MVIYPVAGVAAVFGAKVVPGGGFDVFAAVFVPFDVGFFAEDASAFFADVGDAHEGAYVEADAVVEVAIPPNGLLFEGFPADEDVVGGFAFEDEFEFLFEGFGGVEFFLSSVYPIGDILLLTTNPIAEVGVDEGFEVLAVQFVVIDQGCESVS